MNSFFKDYLEQLDGLFEEINNAIESLPHDALDWVPGPGMNSLAVLAAHIAGSSRYWIGDVAGEDPSGRDRPAEFRTSDLDLSSLKGGLAASLAYAYEYIPTLSLEDLSSPRISPHDNRQVTIGWALAHALEHTALHTGHMQLTRQLWDLSKDEV
ncbi:MAG: DinB family protein [Anaerolineales bacterium]|jgi:uncharacterized damage-inducible protein DinB